MTPSGPGAGGRSAPGLRGGETDNGEEALARPERLCSQPGEGVRGLGAAKERFRNAAGVVTARGPRRDLARSSLEASPWSGLIS